MGRRTIITSRCIKKGVISMVTFQLGLASSGFQVAGEGVREGITSTVGAAAIKKLKVASCWDSLLYKSCYLLNYFISGKLLNLFELWIPYL